VEIVVDGYAPLGHHRLSSLIHTMTKQNDIGIIHPQFTNTFANGASVQTDAKGKPVGVYFGGRKTPENYGITRNQYAIDIIANTPIDYTAMKGNITIFNANA
jgi:hypothetical protein